MRGKILIALLASFLAFLAAEAASRFAMKESHPFPRYLNPVQRKPKPYVMFGGAPYGLISPEEQLNEGGYRGKFPSVPKPATEYRIFVTGGSTVYNGEPPFSELLEQRFRETGYDGVRVYNFGVVSSETSQDLARILFEMADLDPDLIVMYGGGNDIIDRYFADPRPGFPANYMVYENSPILESDVNTYPLFTLMLYGSNLFRRWGGPYFIKKFVPLDRVREEVRYGSKEWKMAVAKNYGGNLLKGYQLAQGLGVRWMAFLQPLLCVKGNRSPEEERHLNRDLSFKAYCLEMMKRFRDEIDRLRNERNLPVVDLSGIFDHDPGPVFAASHLHLPQGKKKAVSDRIFQEIVKTFESEFHQRGTNARTANPKP